MADQNDPTKPVPNDEKFKPQNVASPRQDTNVTDRRGEPGDTEGYDVERGSQPETKKTPS